MLVIPKGFNEWKQNTDSLPTADIQKMYEAGFAGVGTDEQARDELHALVLSRGFSMNGGDMAHQFGIADSYAGKLVLPFMHVEKCFPGCWPGAAQERGDCVSHDEKNACLVTFCSEIVAALPDQITGKVEGIPDVPSAGILEGVLSSEYCYWFRGYSGDGWSCDAAANVTMKNGIMLRKAYPDLGIDLTQYSGSLAGKYGRLSPPENIVAVGREHPVRTMTETSTFEQCRDFLGNGYGISSCGGEGFSSSRNEDGVSSRKGSWSHAMAVIGADDRDDVKRKYGEPLLLILNSWGKWNDGPRRILGTSIDIPIGSFWARWSDVKRRYFVARSSVNGWPRRNLPHYGATGII